MSGPTLCWICWSLFWGAAAYCVFSLVYSLIFGLASGWVHLAREVIFVLFPVPRAAVSLGPSCMLTPWVDGFGSSGAGLS